MLTGIKKENIVPICTDGLVSVKDEPAEACGNFYQYQQGCDEGMDEYDGSAMGHVEACLEEDTDIKMENCDMQVSLRAHQQTLH